MKGAKKVFAFTLEPGMVVLPSPGIATERTIKSVRDLGDMVSVDYTDGSLGLYQKQVKKYIKRQ